MRQSLRMFFVKTVEDSDGGKWICLDACFGAFDHHMIGLKR